jgi:hypothetical protein
MKQFYRSGRGRLDCGLANIGGLAPPLGVGIRSATQATRFDQMMSADFFMLSSPSLQRSSLEQVYAHPPPLLYQNCYSLLALSVF